MKFILFSIVLLAGCAVESVTPPNTDAGSQYIEPPAQHDYDSLPPVDSEKSTGCVSSVYVNGRHYVFPCVRGDRKGTIYQDDFQSK